MTGHPLDLPYEDDPAPSDFPRPPVERIASAAVVLAAVGQTAYGPWPALIFRFANSDGFFPEVLLLLDDDKESGLPDLVAQATAAAFRAARKARAEQ